ncbi:MAG: putative lipid II flippase FtsW [Candidatus Zhuqueibacterota bacterium]
MVKLKLKRQPTRRRLFTGLVKYDMLLLIIVLLLAAYGTAAIYSASNFKAKEALGNSHYFLEKQLFRLFLGLVLMVLVMQIDYHTLQRIAPLLMAATFIMLMYVLFAGNFHKGSRRSIDLLGVVFQPSEIAKYVLILFLSTFLVKKGERIKNFSEGLLPTLFIIALIVIPILMEPDLGTGMLTFIISTMLIFVAGASIYHLAGLGISALTLVGFLLTTFPYQKIRLMKFVDAVRGLQEPPWQVTQSLISFANGGLFGVGLGNSRQKLHFLPQPFTDFIFSIVGEEIGLIGCVLLLILFLAFLWRGLWIASHAPDREGQLLALGMTSSIIIFAWFNAGVALNLLPVTGITMPFISYGGSSLVVHFVAVGVLLNISSQLNGDANGRVALSRNNYVTSANARSLRKKKRR